MVYLVMASNPISVLHLEVVFVRSLVAVHFSVLECEEAKLALVFVRLGTEPRHLVGICTRACTDMATDEVIEQASRIVQKPM